MSLRSLIQSLLPSSLVRVIKPPYHFILAMFGTLYYGFPSRSLIVIGVTGTKGKSTVVELINAICEEAGYKTAFSNTIRFKVGDKTKENRYKMTMPGRFFLQRLLARACRSECDVAIIEMTSEGSKQFRHRFISLDALVVTNISPEHIEAHGSYEAYVDAKLAIARTLSRSSKRPRAIIANADTEYAERFLATDVEQTLPYRLADAANVTYNERSTSFTYNNENITLSLPGEFNLENALAALTTAHFLSIDTHTAARALSNFQTVSGRLEYIESGQPFPVIVDYAHTPASLEALYAAVPQRYKICVLGNAGGGRDTWKRPEMGSIAEKCCSYVILTNEDPYDEDPETIVSDMIEGMKQEPLVLMNRREAIAHALKHAQEYSANNDVAVIISGKGTDPYIMEAGDTRTPWSDARVTREELKKIGYESE